jgi:hypothetical protein
MRRWDIVEMWLRELLEKEGKDPKDTSLIGAEIGVKEGRFSEHMLQAFPTLTLWCVDPWEVQEVSEGETYADWEFNHIFNEYRQRTGQFGTRCRTVPLYSSQAANAYQPALNLDEGQNPCVPDELDFVFIDAQHTYEAVKEDIGLWLPKIRAGGLLCGHDWQNKFPGVSKAVNEMLPPLEIMLGHDSVWGYRKP